jgi:hypothetical protein
MLLQLHGKGHHGSLVADGIHMHCKEAPLLPVHAHTAHPRDPLAPCVCLAALLLPLH